MTENKPHLPGRNKIIYIVLSSLLLISFFVFTLIVRSDALRHFDFDLTVKLQAKTPLRFDDFFSFLSVVGRFEYTTSILILLLLIHARFSIKKHIKSFLIVGLFLGAHVVELIGKTILEQPGPPRMFLRSHFSEFPGLHVFTEASYPSGHSLRIVFLGIITAYIILKSGFNKPLKYLFYAGISIICFTMVFSRVSLGEHWTTDVIGGSILGLSLGILSLIFL